MTKQYTFTSDARGKRGAKTKPSPDGGTEVGVVPVNKLPGHDRNSEARLHAVTALQEAVDGLYKLASGKIGADAVYKRICKHIGDFAKFRV